MDCKPFPVRHDSQRLCAPRHGRIPRLARAATKLLPLALAFAAASAGAQAWLPDGVGFTWGHGNTTMIYGLETNWDSPRFLDVTKRIGLDSRIVADLSYWQGRESSPHQQLWEIGVTPTVRWLAPQMANVTPFVDVGVGVHLLSQHRINNERDFGGAFQFGERGTVGLAFGTTTRYEIGAFIQHVSNGGIQHPNNGITVLGAMVRASLH